MIQIIILITTMKEATRTATYKLFLMQFIPNLFRPGMCYFGERYQDLRLENYGISPNKAISLAAHGLNMPGFCRIILNLLPESVDIDHNGVLVHNH